MARIRMYLFITAMIVMVVSGSNWFEKETYRPYGIKMCQGLSQNSTDCVIFSVETLTCCRLPSNCSTTHTLKRQSTGAFIFCSMEKITKNNICTALAVIPKDDHYTEQSTVTSLEQTPAVQTAVRMMTVMKKEDERGTITTNLQGSTKFSLQNSESDVSEQMENITLHQACAEGKLDVMKYILLKRLQDINCRSVRGSTPVMEAALRRQNAVFDFLISRGCDLSLVNNNNNNILHVACVGGDVDIVMKLLDDLDYDIDSRGMNGWTPVMFAACSGGKDVVELLIHKGCNVTIIDYFKNNLLHIACRGGKMPIVKYIISKHVFGINVRGHGGRTPVMVAAKNGHVRVVDFLRQYGCDMKIVDHRGNCILHLACFGGHVDMVKYIISKHIVSINVPGYKLRTPVMFAAENGHVLVVDFLRQYGCEMNIVDHGGNCILHSACFGGHVDMVKYIISKHIVSINVPGFKLRTPVMFAAENGHVQVVDFLRKIGCDMKARDKEGNSILHRACFGGHLHMIKYIISRNIVSINERGHNRRTSIMIAAERGHVGVVDFLTKNGFDMKTLDYYSNNILHTACLCGHVEMVKFIISRHMLGVNARGFQGRTPVMMAAEMGYVEVVDLLRKNDCDMKIVDNYGNSVLHLACLGGHVDMVKYLIRWGFVSKREVNKNGNTPIQMARAHGHGAVVAVLETRK